MILDAYAVLAFLRDEPAADAVDEIMSTESGAAVTSVGLGEVLDHLIRVIGIDPGVAHRDVIRLNLGNPIAVTGDIGAAAGKLRARWYHRTRCAVSMADCIAAETARSLGVHVVTSDPHLLDVCQAESIKYVDLPDSTGSRWQPRRDSPSGDTQPATQSNH
jgi:PIN domain nuclease of toxin-antitoxin system